jgi:hypothetical protein
MFRMKQVHQQVLLKLYCWLATGEIPGAFMQADMNDVVHIRFERQLVKLIRQLDSAYYSPFVTEENGELVLYVLMRKAQYGTLKAAKLFWQCSCRGGLS